MSNRLESLEVTNDTLFRGEVFGTEFNIESLNISLSISNSDLIIIENEISNIGDSNIIVSTNDSTGTDSAGDLKLSVGKALGTGTDGTLQFEVSGVNYTWPTAGPTANGQSLKVFSGGGTNNVVLEWS